MCWNLLKPATYIFSYCQKKLVYHSLFVEGYSLITELELCPVFTITLQKISLKVYDSIQEWHHTVSNELCVTTFLMIMTFGDNYATLSFLTGLRTLPQAAVSC